jgi:hypothetical protein
MADKQFWSRKVTIYLFHFEQRLHHAGHYLGSTDDIERRSAEHGTSEGGKLMQAIARKGIGAKIVRTWENTPRYFEAILHNFKNSPLLCPLCSGPKALKRGIFNPNPKSKGKKKKEQ